MADHVNVTGDHAAVAMYDDNIVIEVNGQQVWPGEPVPPDPNPEPPETGMLTLINNETDLRQALTAAKNGARIVVDPASPAITVTQTISLEITQPNFYFDGSGLQIGTNIANFGHLLDFTGGKEGFRLKNLYVTGSYPDRKCGDGIRFVNAPQGNNEAFYNFQIGGIRIEHVSGNGIYMEGSFEGSVNGVEFNDIGKDGMVISGGTSGGSTVCQLNVHNAQCSRCDGWGAQQINGADQVTWYSPKFVNNGMGGLHATDGILLVDSPQGENTGETIVVVDRQAWPGGEVRSLQCASDGAWTRNWVTNTGPTKYGIKCPAGAVQHTGVFKGRAYGSGPVQLWAPGSQAAGLDVEKVNPGAQQTQMASTKPEGVPQQYIEKEQNRQT
jgi:hypothetical protein